MGSFVKKNRKLEFIKQLLGREKISKIISYKAQPFFSNGLHNILWEHFEKSHSDAQCLCEGVHFAIDKRVVVNIIRDAGI